MIEPATSGGRFRISYPHSSPIARPHWGGVQAGNATLAFPPTINRVPSGRAKEYMHLQSHVSAADRRPVANLKMARLPRNPRHRADSTLSRNELRRIIADMIG